MLTRKQKWRRTVSHQSLPRRSDSHIQFEEYMKATRFETSGTELYSRAASEPSIRTTERLKNEIPRMRRCTTGDIRHVHWSERSRVILVPCRQDYTRNGFDSDIWWERNDYDTFKSSAHEEVISVMQEKNIDLSSAMSELYQSEELFGSCSDLVTHERDQQAIIASPASSTTTITTTETISTSTSSSSTAAPTTPPLTTTTTESNENSYLSEGNISKLNESFPPPHNPMRSATPKPPPTSSRSNTPLQSRSYSRQGSKESVDSQSSTGSGERRPINFFEIRSEKGMHDNGQAIQTKKDTSKKFVHPLAAIADM